MSLLAYFAFEEGCKMSKLLKKAREYEEVILEKIPKEQRPVFHFSSPTGWINDPNGFSEYQGEYHLFYQYYPYATHWDSMHWGHAKSSDFVKWEYLPAAMAPDKEYDNFGVFSGTAMEEGDKQILVYTGVKEETLENGEKRITQNQCLAIGDGKNYEKAAENPIIPGDLLPEGDSREDFRDPKIWKEDGRYYVVAGNRNADGSGQIVLFYSDDLKKWSFGSVLEKCNNELGKMWECPDFFKLDDKHILLISPQDIKAENPEFHNGNNTAFLLGNYDKGQMKFHRTELQSVDYGLDFYAPQTMLTKDGRRIMIGWMQSWDNHMCPSDYQWSGMMTVPRELSVKEGRVYQVPVRELENYRTNEVSYTNVSVGEEMVCKGVEGRTADISLYMKGEDYSKFRVKVASNGKYYSEIVYDRAEKILTFDRTYSGYGRDVISTRSMVIDGDYQELKLRILIDKYSVEIFVNEGRQVMTSLIYTEQEAGGITFASDGNAYMDVTKYDIEER